MFGLNRLITLVKTTRAADGFGGYSELEGSTEGVDRWSSIRATIQSHVLNNLPPPGDRTFQSGQMLLDEYRCWIPVGTLTALGVVPKDNWIIIDDNDVRFRIKAVIDDAGRRHHYLIRLERYD